VSNTELTELQITTAKADIDAMSREHMARLWRFAPAGHPYFDRRLPLHEYFAARFEALGKFSPQISRRIGWKP